MCVRVSRKLFSIFKTQTQFRAQYGRKSIPVSGRNNSDDLIGYSRRCFHKTRRETFYMLLRLPRSSVSFHPDFPLVDSHHHHHHHREGLKPIDHVLDYSGPVACQTLSGTEPFPCICQPVDRFSFFPKRSPLRSSSRTISRERSRINPISSLERSFLPCCLMAAFLIINFPSLTEEIAERREISLPWYCRSGCYWARLSMINGELVVWRY